MSTLTGNSLNPKHSLVKSISYVVAVTAAVLMIPLVAMQFTNEVVWDGADFIAAGLLLALTGLVLTFALRKLRTTKGRLIAAAVIGLGFLVCWAEMAVGIFTNLGS
ncbi:MAG: hypothetical protein ACREWI_17365 [Telluria sp.]